MIKLNLKDKEITNSNGDLIEYNKENLEKYFLQTDQFKLNDDLTWNITKEKAIAILRSKRDAKLRETDYLFLSDTTKIISTEEKAKLKTERQRLRDITENITENTSIDEVVKRIRSI